MILSVITTRCLPEGLDEVMSMINCLNHLNSTRFEKNTLLNIFIEMKINLKSLILKMIMIYRLQVDN